MIYYKVLPLSLTDKSSFAEASAEELRVLLALIECEGTVESAEALAKLAKASKARTTSALVFWEEERVITKNDSPSVTEEFESRIRRGELLEEKSLSVAKSIRDNALSEMIDECVRIMKRTELSTEEIKAITGLNTQYSLSEEYILTLLSHLLENRRTKLTVSKLVDKAIDLSTNKNINTAEELDIYFKDIKCKTETEYNLRRRFGLSGRALSKTERDLFEKWGRTYGYGEPIIDEAYDIAVNTKKKEWKDKSYIQRVDEILSRWYEAGCRTVLDCRKQYEADEEEKRAEKESQKSAAAEKKKKSKEKLDNFGSFDVDAALMKAIERSFDDDFELDENNQSK